MFLHVRQFEVVNPASGDLREPSDPYLKVYADVPVRNVPNLILKPFDALGIDSELVLTTRIVDRLSRVCSPMERSALLLPLGLPALPSVGSLLLKFSAFFVFLSRDPSVLTSITFGPSRSFLS